MVAGDLSRNRLWPETDAFVANVHGFRVREIENQITGRPDVFTYKQKRRRPYHSMMFSNVYESDAVRVSSRRHRGFGNREVFLNLRTRGGGGIRHNGPRRISYAVRAVATRFIIPIQVSSARIY